MQYGHGKVEGTGKEWVILNVAGTFTHMIAKGMALFLGYQEGGQRDVIQGVRTSIERQPRIKGGIDMSASPLVLAPDASVILDGIAGVQDRTLGQTTYHLIGSAKLSREFGRTWMASLGYNRGVRNVEPIGDPIVFRLESWSQRRGRSASGCSFRPVSANPLDTSAQGGLSKTWSAVPNCPSRSPDSWPGEPTTPIAGSPPPMLCCLGADW